MKGEPVFSAPKAPRKIKAPKLKKARGTPKAGLTRTGALKRWQVCIPWASRFWLKVWRRGDCWEWRGARQSEGYGIFIDSGGSCTTAHRIAYEYAYDILPDGLVPDHLCRNRWCVRPSHLEAVTEKVNILRGNAPPAKHAVKTHCKRGHLFDERNTIHERHGRRCRICSYANWNHHRAVKHAKHS